jgi:L-fuconolactonase
VAATVAAVSDIRFVLDHAGKPSIARGFRGPDDRNLRHWTADISALAALPNVAVKVSGLVTEADWNGWTEAELTPVIEHVLNSFGSGRVMFGSDWPVCLLAADYGRVKATLAPALASCSVDVVESMWGGTAREWYRLGQS